VIAPDTSPSARYVLRNTITPMKTKSSSLEKVLLLVAGVFALPTLPLAHAVPTLQLTDGVTTMTIADMSGGDLNPTVGAVTFLGPVGSFSVNVTTGISKPVLGSAALPFLDLNSINVSGPLANTLTIRFSDDSFGPTPGSVTARIGGTTAGMLSYSTFADASNTLFGTSTLLTQQGPFGNGAFSGTSFANLGFLSPFSLTQEVVINHGASPGGLVSTSFNAELQAAVPDGGSTITLLGAVLVALESLRRRFRGAIKIA
jgi:hypothetical protein